MDVIFAMVLDDINFFILDILYANENRRLQQLIENDDFATINKNLIEVKPLAKSLPNLFYNSPIDKLIAKNREIETTQNLSLDKKKNFSTSKRQLFVENIKLPSSVCITSREKYTKKSDQSNLSYVASASKIINKSMDSDVFKTPTRLPKKTISPTSRQLSKCKLLTISLRKTKYNRSPVYKKPTNSLKASSLKTLQKTNVEIALNKDKIENKILPCASSNVMSPDKNYNKIRVKVEHVSPLKSMTKSRLTTTSIQDEPSHIDVIMNRNKRTKKLNHSDFKENEIKSSPPSNFTPDKQRFSRIKTENLLKTGPEKRFKNSPKCDMTNMIEINIITESKRELMENDANFIEKYKNNFKLQNSSVQCSPYTNSRLKSGKEHSTENSNSSISGEDDQKIRFSGNSRATRSLCKKLKIETTEEIDVGNNSDKLQLHDLYLNENNSEYKINMDIKKEINTRSKTILVDNSIPDMLTESNVSCHDILPVKITKSISKELLNANCRKTVRTDGSIVNNRDGNLINTSCIKYDKKRKSEIINDKQKKHEHLTIISGLLKSGSDESIGNRIQTRKQYMNSTSMSPESIVPVIQNKSRKIKRNISIDYSSDLLDGDTTIQSLIETEKNKTSPEKIFNNNKVENENHIIPNIEIHKSKSPSKNIFTSTYSTTPSENHVSFNERQTRQSKLTRNNCLFFKPTIIRKSISIDNISASAFSDKKGTCQDSLLKNDETKSHNLVNALLSPQKNRKLRMKRNINKEYKSDSYQFVSSTIDNKYPKTRKSAHSVAVSDKTQTLENSADTKIYNHGKFKRVRSNAENMTNDSSNPILHKNRQYSSSFTSPSKSWVNSPRKLGN